MKDKSVLFLKSIFKRYCNKSDHTALNNYKYELVYCDLHREK